MPSLRMKWVERRVKQSIALLDSRDLLTFLFFVGLSALFWLLQVSQEEYETKIRIPLEIVNLPESTILTTDLPTHIQVLVKDKGTALMGKSGEWTLAPLLLDYTQYKPERSLLQITETNLFDLVRKVLPPSNNIIAITPSSLQLYLTSSPAKEYDVVLQSTFLPSINCVQSGPISYTPTRVKVVAPEEILDSMQYVSTEFVRMSDLKDTLVTLLPLEKIPGVKFLTDNIEITVPIEEFTEKQLTVPIKTLQLPSGYNLRTFPAKASVTCFVGLSHFPQVTDSLFSVGVNYNKAKGKEPLEKLPVELLKSPSYVYNIKFQPDSVEFVLEEIYSYD